MSIFQLKDIKILKIRVKLYICLAEILHDFIQSIYFIKTSFENSKLMVEDVLSFDPSRGGRDDFSFSRPYKMTTFTAVPWPR